MTRLVLQNFLWGPLFGFLIMWPAGTWCYPGAWAFSAIFIVGGVVFTVWLYQRDPYLLRERMKFPIQKEQKPWDRLFMATGITLFLLWLPLMGWDAGRSGFSAFPGYVQILGAASILLYGFGACWAFSVNSFAAPVVKVKKEQKVAATGPYAIVRHPMYTSVIFLFLGLPLLLDSWLGLCFFPLFLLGLVWRIRKEEATLVAELPGYVKYTQKVRWRLLPYVW